jgi:hypothetical protein
MGNARPEMERRLGDTGEVPNDVASRDERRNLPTRRANWGRIVLPTCLILFVSIPVMVVEEDWHGHPMIDQGTHLWILPTVLVALAFLLGGALAGFRRPPAAVPYAFVSASLALVALLLCAVFRRLWVAHEGVPMPVVDLWCLGVIGALTLGLVGSLVGRRLAVDRS